MVPIVCPWPELLAMPMVLPLAWPERRTLLPLRVKGPPNEKVMPSSGMGTVSKLLLRAVNAPLPKMSESPALGGLSQLPAEPQLESVAPVQVSFRSEEHTSELQSLRHLVCR